MEYGGQNGSVVYFDTETAFSGVRFVEVAVNRFPDYFGENTVQKTEEISRKILVFNVTSSSEVIQKYVLISY